MLFNSLSFVVFIFVVLAVHNLKLPWKVKKLNLLLASYLFYAVWNPPFILLLWISTMVDFVIGKKLYAERNQSKRKMWVGVSLFTNLGMLAFFKYGGFILDNFTAMLAMFGIEYQAAASSIILPVGISFYTFQTLSYTLDLYQRKNPPERSLLDFALFVTFFPQLVAGPIVRPGELIPQFKKPVVASRQQFMDGMLLLSLGLFMKVVLADDLLASPADLVFSSPQFLTAFDAWLGVLAFSGQIFFDFAGYSTCAIGIAASLGFSLPQNFRYPYAAIGFSDFWRRWHITLSSWLRDYVYIPLGGNRMSKFRTHLNLMLTMLIGGLWHGASWTFVVWGALHGLFLSAERMVQAQLKSGRSISIAPELALGTPRPVTVKASFLPLFINRPKVQLIFAALVTFFLVNVTWVFFRASDFATAGRLLTSMFGYAENGIALLPTLDIIKVISVTILLVTTHWLMRDTTVLERARNLKWWQTGLVWGLILIFLVVSQKSSDSFIYFQF